MNSGFKEKVENIIDDVYSAEIEKKTAYARMWSPKADVKGRPINEQEFEELYNNRSNYKGIFIVDRGEYERNAVGEVYFNNQPVFRQPGRKPVGKASGKKRSQKVKEYLSPLDYRILVYILKKNSSPPEIFDVIENCWFLPDDAARFRNERKREVAGENIDTPTVDSTKNYRTSVGKVSSFVSKFLDVQLNTRLTGKYGLTRAINFFVIELYK